MRRFDPRLYLVTDSAMVASQRLPDFVERAIAGGVTMLQVREKNSDTRSFLALAQALKRVANSHNIPLIVNDRIDIAMAVDADGVHIGQGDMPYAIARGLLGEQKIIGLSVENMRQLAEANSLDVDYLGISAVFSTATKPDTRAAFGVAGAAEAARNTQHRTVAIGGINIDNVDAVVGAGVDGIAVVSALLRAEDPQSAAAALKEKILRGMQGRAKAARA